jgi:hypothetical protein
VRRLVADEAIAIAQRHSVFVGLCPELPAARPAELSRSWWLSKDRWRVRLDGGERVVWVEVDRYLGAVLRDSGSWGLRQADLQMVVAELAGQTVMNLG